MECLVSAFHRWTLLWWPTARASDTRQFRTKSWSRITATQFLVFSILRHRIEHLAGITSRPNRLHIGADYVTIDNTPAIGMVSLADNFLETRKVAFPNINYRGNGILH